MVVHEQLPFSGICRRTLHAKRLHSDISSIRITWKQQLLHDQLSCKEKSLSSDEKHPTPLCPKVAATESAPSTIAMTQHNGDD
jgi:hypothetical protein